MLLHTHTRSSEPTGPCGERITNAWRPALIMTTGPSKSVHCGFLRKQQHLYHCTQPWSNGSRVVAAPKASLPLRCFKAVSDPKPSSSQGACPDNLVLSPLVLELLAGSVQLSRCLLDVGLSPLAFDRFVGRPRRTPLASCSLSFELASGRLPDGP